jgi:hypothetical protein
MYGSITYIKTFDYNSDVRAGVTRGESSAFRLVFPRTHLSSSRSPRVSRCYLESRSAQHSAFHGSLPPSTRSRVAHRHSPLACRPSSAHPRSSPASIGRSLSLSPQRPLASSLRPPLCLASVLPHDPPRLLPPVMSPHRSRHFPAHLVFPTVPLTLPAPRPR